MELLGLKAPPERLRQCGILTNDGAAFQPTELLRR